MLNARDLVPWDAWVIAAYKGGPCFIDLDRLRAHYFESSYLIAARAIDKARRAKPE